ncbi:MAG: hypothetical protein QMC70_08625 [Bacteroidia bacterium]|jgi:hypothetical protein|tara:strand:+ start:3739 stop:3927 length:189 start_codon:yes stop_codon:yes gene_type:complete
MNIGLILLQQTLSDTTNRAPDATGWFWGVSEVIVTLIIFVGVYYIFKPVLDKKEGDQDKASD